MRTGFPIAWCVCIAVTKTIWTSTIPISSSGEGPNRDECANGDDQVSDYHYDSSLDELEGALTTGNGLASGLIIRCRAARSKPISRLSVGDLRLLIGQRMGLDYLVPIALAVLENDPLAHEHYRGELLIALLGVPREFWIAHAELAVRLVELKQLVEEVHRTLSEDILPLMHGFGAVSKS